eukprot:Gb_20541 [translate_table: standard]
MVLLLEMYQKLRKRRAVVRALIEEERKLLSSEKEPNCYLDMLLKEGKELQGNQLETAILEPLVESIITSHVTMVWAMFELGRNPECQKYLRKEIKRACGDDDVHKLLIRETLRKYLPLPLSPLRYVHEDVELDGYHVPAGWKILLNIHRIGEEEKQWENAKTWNPDRHLTARGFELMLVTSPEIALPRVGSSDGRRSYDAPGTPCHAILAPPHTEEWIRIQNYRIVKVEKEVMPSVDELPFERYKFSRGIRGITQE